MPEYTSAIPTGLPFILSAGASPVTPTVGLLYDCAINGVGFLFKDKKSFKWGFLPSRKEQFDTGKEPGEQSFSDDYWRRSRSSWHMGAGQEWVDGQASVEFRYNTSKGIDPWTQNQLALLPSTSIKRSSANTNLRLLRAGAYLYMVDGTSVVFTADPTVGSPTFTAMTGLTSGTVQSITSDGTNVYTAVGGKIHRTAIGTAAAGAAWATLASVDRVGFANGFLLASAGRQLYILDASGTPTEKTPGHVALSSGSGWTWTGFTDGPTGPYAAGKSGELGIIYRGVLDNVGALNYFVVAATLPDGETVETIQSYLNQYLIIGTSRGVRLGAIQQETGAVQYGPLVPTGQACAAVEPQDRYVWFGWPAFDSTDGGLGRLDLATFTDALRPAYASDLQYTSTAAVQGIATHSDKRFFTLSGVGLIGEGSTKVSSAVLTTGKVRWSTMEPKLLQYVDIFNTSLPAGASIQLEVSKEDAPYALVGTNTQPNSVTFEGRVSQLGKWFEMRYTFGRATDTTKGPTMTGWIMRAVPTPRPQRYYDLTVLCFDYESALNHQTVGHEGHAVERLNLLQGYRETGEPVTFQGPDFGRLVSGKVQYPSYTCVVDDVAFEGDVPSGGTSEVAVFGGHIRILLREISGV